jgi:hypothetical protein
MCVSLFQERNLLVPFKVVPKPDCVSKKFPKAGYECTLEKID